MRGSGIEKGIKLDLMEKVTLEKKLEGNERVSQHKVPREEPQQIFPNTILLHVFRRKNRQDLAIGCWERRGVIKNDPSGMILGFLAQVSFSELSGH